LRYPAERIGLLVPESNSPMPTRLLLLTAVWLTWPGGADPGEAPSPDVPAVQRPKAASYVSLLKGRDGNQALVISYPWRVYRRASVEVRLVTGKDPGPAVVRPLFFVKQYMQGAVAATLYQCEDKAESARVRQTVTTEGVEFEVVGQRNRLERPAVYVVHRFPEKQPAPGVGAVFCLLSPWAINERLLYLDLPQADFAEPGTLYVWFLRDDAVIWREVLPWPGYRTGEMTKHE
jgi:hypothetical protein